VTRRFRNVICDFDGTLTDSREDIAAAQLWALHSLGITGLAREDLFPHIGKPLAETFRLLLPPGLHEKIPDAVALYSEYYPPRSLVTTRLFPGVAATLERLRDAGIGLAVASTKRGPGILRATEHFGITRFFDQLQGCDDLPVKPDPATLESVLRQQGWTREETLMVGDTELDIVAGQRAGTATCAVTYGAQPASVLRGVRPDFLIDAFPQLLAIVL
jgi:phosphoglycolate phosphatase-like HAD superfamily hydrolase